MSKPTNIVVYFDSPDVMGYPFDEHNYFLSYQGFSELCKKNGVNFYIARGRKSYLGKMKFRGGWKFAGKKLTAVNCPIKADVIYVKGAELRTEKGATRVNHQELMEICADKLKTYELFKKYMIKTYPINENNWQKVFAKIKTNKVVVKPENGMEGRGIIVTKKNKFNFSMLNGAYAPFLAQEFIDCSAGIPGIVKGRHDLRLYIFNGIAKVAEYRQPKQGSYLANIAQGGSLTVLPLSKVPAWAIKFVSTIDKHFKKYFPRIYTIDLMYANNRPYLVELNSRPGLPFKDWSYYNELHLYIFETLMSALM
jgi:glutathione synthase/RimK-type ligase-like ATP-grasp enzyme